ncbi:MAG: hypothetical protein ACWA44_13040 [Thiotrichales bacterium]
MKAMLISALILTLLTGCDGGIVGTGSGPTPEPSASMDASINENGALAPDATEQPQNRYQIEVAPGYQAWLSINPEQPDSGWQALHALTVLTSKLSEIEAACPTDPQNPSCTIEASQISVFYGEELLVIENALLENWMTAAGLSDGEKITLRDQQQQASVQGSTFTLGAIQVKLGSEGKTIGTTGVTSGSGKVLPAALITQLP